MALDWRNFVARRVAMLFKDGDVVNLGIGLPTLIPNHIPAGLKVTLQGENGVLGLGPAPPLHEINKDVFDAGGAWATLNPGGSFFDSAVSFGLIRGGHVDITVLGALQVDREGNLANWMVPGKLMAGYGGAMDLITCAKKVIVAMEHTNKGDPKIFNKCSFPLTGAKCVDIIVTNMALIEVTDEGLVVREIAPDTTVEQLKAATEADLIIPDDVKVMTVY
jgi:acetate CoA/acetoacetate CoA-transferase beta subunit